MVEFLYWEGKKVQMTRRYLILTCLLLSLSLALLPGLAGAGLSDGAGWPQFHGDAANTGYSASKAPDTSDPAWVSENINANNSSSVVVAEGKVFVYCCEGEEFGATASSVYCLDESTGAKLWDTPVAKADSGSWSSPAYSNGNVFIGSGKYLYCLDAAVGSEKWKYNLASPVVNGSPCVADGKVFIGNWAGGYYYCVDENTGAFKWKFGVTGSAQGKPAYIDGKVYLTSWGFGAAKNSHIYCVDALSGSLIWHQDGVDDDGKQSACGSAAVADGKVFITTYNFYGDGRMAALDAAGGSIIWSVYTNRTDTTPAYYDGKIYISGGCVGYSAKQTTSCFDANTGNLRWEKEGLGNWTCSVAVADNKVFVGKPDSDGFFDYIGTYALNADNGQVVWSYDKGGSSPAVANGRVYTISDGKVYALGRYDPGYPAWDLNMDGKVDVLDMILVGQKFGQAGSPGWLGEDVNKDGKIDVLDMILIGQHWTG